MEVQWCKGKGCYQYNNARLGEIMGDCAASLEKPCGQVNKCVPTTHPTSELRKDKGERAPGGVTPGEDPNYYAAAARGADEVRDKSPVKDAKQQRLRPPDKVRAELMLQQVGTQGSHDIAAVRA